MTAIDASLAAPARPDRPVHRAPAETGDPARSGAEHAAGSAGASTRREAIKRWAMRAFWIVALIVGGWLIHRTFRTYGIDHILSAIAAVPTGRLIAAGAFAAASYACLTLFDWLGTRYVERPLPWRHVATASFVSLSLGHSIGFAGLSSGAIRYRFYNRWGFSTGDVARLVVFCGTTVGIGLTTLAGIALVADPWLARDVTGLDETTSRLAGLACLAVVAAYVALAAFRPAPLRLWRWTLDIPSPRLAIAQVVVGTVNFALVAACLHQALAALSDAPYLGVASVYVLANVATLITHVPGGLGVIESVVTALVPAAQAIGAVVVFRVVYFLVPLAIGATVLAFVELRLARRE